MFRPAFATLLVGAALVTGCATGGKSDYVGTARMLADLTIEQQMVERGPSGALGEARIVLKPGDPAYRETIDLVGGLRPGEMKAVPAGGETAQPKAD